MGDVSRIHEFITTCCQPPIPSAVTATDSGGSGSTTLSRSVWTMEVDVFQLFDYCPAMAALANHSPLTEVLRVLRTEVYNIMQQTDEPYCRIKLEELCLRPVHLPPLMAATAVSYAATQQSGGIVVLSGTIIRLCAKRVVPYLQELHCPVCRKDVEIYSSPYDRGKIIKARCENKSCKGAELVVKREVWMDHAECRVQQCTIRSAASGRLPRSVLVSLDDELANKCSAGQQVEVIGVVRTRWKSTYARTVPVIEMVVWALNITPLDEATVTADTPDLVEGDEGAQAPQQLLSYFHGDHTALRAALISSTCPQLFGTMAPRLGVLLSCIGGSPIRDERTGHRVRGTIHCLLVGDPSTGKSQLLRFSAQISPRAVLTTGFTSTNAGLTAAATKEFGEWALEPGALVLSDGGSCIIDELRTISASDRTALHEAMEQQTISVAKAGLVVRLRTECSIVAACNPPTRRGTARSGSSSTELGIGGPLLSRFDLIFLLWDSFSSDHDEFVASHIINVSAAVEKPPLPLDTLNNHLRYVRQKYTEGGPLLDDDAADLVSRYYEAQRSRGPSPALSDVVPVTVRLLESLIRLSQAHAKLLLRDVCGVEDAAMAVFLMERTAHALKTRIEGVTTPDGEEIYTSSKCLEDYFLFMDQEGLNMQRQVLTWMVQTFGNVSSSPQPDSGMEWIKSQSLLARKSNGYTSEDVPQSADEDKQSASLSPISNDSPGLSQRSRRAIEKISRCNKLLGDSDTLASRKRDREESNDSRSVTVYDNSAFDDVYRTTPLQTLSQATTLSAPARQFHTNSINNNSTHSQQHETGGQEERGNIKSQSRPVTPSTHSPTPLTMAPVPGARRSLEDIMSSLRFNLNK